MTRSALHYHRGMTTQRFKVAAMRAIGTLRGP
jgi:hypothetical protein